MAVITVSRQYGSGGDEISALVCQQLGYHQFDRRQIARAAFEAGFSEQEIINYSEYSEENTKLKKFVDYLLRRRSKPSIKSVDRLESIARSFTAEDHLYNEASALALVQKAIKAAYQHGNMLVIGRGGQMILRDYPCVLHIRIEAPLEYRIQRVNSQLKEEQQAYYPQIEIRRTAQDLIAERDADSASYIQRFYVADWADPLLYHAVLNTAKLSIDQVAKIIVDMVHSLFPE
ncbi:MAG TPA: cytidylate kinase-like family protein [Anaerolineaceae bacterium]|nr:cytidylate kinase-like family protein [Anaerolineaceae bacterium]